MCKMIKYYLKGLLIICFSIQGLFGQESEIIIQSAHASHISLVELDKTNNLLITYGSYSDKELKIWDLYSGFLLKSINFSETIKNIFVDEDNKKLYVGDELGIKIFDSESLKIIDQIQIKYLKNFVLDASSSKLYYVSGETRFEGQQVFHTLNLNTEEKTTSVWPGKGYPMSGKLIMTEGNALIEFRTNFQENIYYDTVTNKFEFFNGDHLGFFDNLDLLYQKIIDDKHLKFIRYNPKKNNVVWEKTIEAGRTKKGFTNYLAPTAFTPDKSSLWVAPSMSPLLELDAQTGEIIGAIEKALHRTKLVADNQFVYALEPVSDTFGAPTYFNKYRRYATSPLTTYGHPIFNVNNFKPYSIDGERGIVFNDLKGNLGSVSVSEQATRITNYQTNYNQDFSLYGNFYLGQNSKDVYLGMNPKEGVKALTIEKPNSFKSISILNDYQDRANVHPTDSLIVTHNNNKFSIATIKGDEMLFSDVFKNAKNIVSCTSVTRNASNEIAFLTNDEIVFDEVYKRQIHYYNYKNQQLLWQREGPYHRVYFIENNSKLLALNVNDQEAEILNVSTGATERKFSIPNISYSSHVSVNPSNSLIMISDYKSNLSVFDIATGKEFSRVGSDREHQFISNDVYVSKTNGYFIFYNVKTHQEILRLYIFLDGEWLAHTPTGHFEGSQKAWGRVLFSKGGKVISLNQVFNNFYTPNLIHATLQNEMANKEQSVYELNKAPEVAIKFNNGTRNIELIDDFVEFNTKVKSQEIQLTANPFNDEIKEYRLFHNGKRIQPNQKGSYTINYIEGENTITAVAINSQNTESTKRGFIAKFEPGSTDGTNEIQVHLVTIGIDKYRNPKYNLNYAVADARGFKKSVSDGINDIVAKINSYEIKDKDANKDQIISVLSSIAETANPEDVFVFYYAGHGVMTEGESQQFYIVPHNVTQLYGNEDGLLKKGISASELKSLSSKIPSQKQLFVLDACQSGGAINSLVSRGAAEEKAIAQLARSTGTHWLTASGSEQYATEFETLGHGVFTYALLEALSGKADSGDNSITVNEIKAYIESRVPELSEQYKGTPQFPSSFGFGQDFPIAIKK